MTKETGNTSRSRIVTLVGMFGVGKSFWSNKFKESGYKVFSIDDMIAKRLAEVIKNTNGDSSVSYGSGKVASLAKWMGFPGDKRYKKNCKIYLDLEESITKNVLDLALQSDKKTILDTTGSVIYLSNKLQKELRDKTFIINLDISKKKQSEAFRTFCKFPKPIIWGKHFKKINGENENTTLRRCCKELLEYRLDKYRKFSNKIIGYKIHRSAKEVKDIFK